MFFFIHACTSTVKPRFSKLFMSVRSIVFLPVSRLMYRAFLQTTYIRSLPNTLLILILIFITLIKLAGLPFAYAIVYHAD